MILRPYYVIGPHQIDGLPELELPGEPEFDPIEKAEKIMAAMQERTGLKSATT